MSHQQSQTLKKITTDVSLFLSTVIAGAAIVTAVDTYFNIAPLCRGINWSFVCQAMVVIITTLRFFHGNVMWYSWELTGVKITRPPTTIQMVMNKLAHYYVHILQYILFLIAGKVVGEINLFIKILLTISLVDVFWTGFNWLHEEDKDLRRALGSWFLLNSATIIILVVLLALSIYQLHHDICCYIIAAFYCITTLLDYLINPKLFFGVEKGSE